MTIKRAYTNITILEKRMEVFESNERTRVRRIQKVSPILEVGVVNGLGDKSAEVDERFKEGLPIISCECGAQILRSARFAGYESCNQDSCRGTQRKRSKRQEQLINIWQNQSTAKPTYPHKAE